MSEQRSIRYTQWIEQPGSYEECFQCRKNGRHSYGVMMKRYVTGRDGDSHTEYKIQCRICKRTTDIHRHKLLTEKEWAGRQEPEEILVHRSKKQGGQNG